jgi:hypothetical protein
MLLSKVWNAQRLIYTTQAITVSSSLPYDAAFRQLSDGLASSDSKLMYGILPNAERAVRGRVSRDLVYVYASKGTRNSWRPVFIGQLRTRPESGSELIGELGTDLSVRKLAIILAGLDGLGLLSGIAGAIVNAVVARWGSVAYWSIFAGIALCLFAFYLLMSFIAYRAGQPDGEYLGEWLSDRLNPDGGA